MRLQLCPRHELRTCFYWHTVLGLSVWNDSAFYSSKPKHTFMVSVEVNTPAQPSLQWPPDFPVHDFTSTNWMLCEIQSWSSTLNTASTSCGSLKLESSHGENIYTTEASKCCKPWFIPHKFHELLVYCGHNPLFIMMLNFMCQLDWTVGVG